MEKEQTMGRKQIIKKVATIFLVVLLLLTFFSNTIMNYSLPEVATEPVTSGTVSNKVRGQGTVEANSDYEVNVSGTRMVKEVNVEVGDKVEEGQVLFTFEESENTDLTTAEDELAAKELEYAKALIKSLPDYTEDNMNIKEAKEALSKAIEDREEAKENDKKLKAAQKEEKKLKEKVETQQAKVDKLQEQFDDYGEIGNYDEAAAAVKTAEQELERLKIELSDLKEDLAMLTEEGEDTKQKEREIRDKEAEITQKEAEVKAAKEKESTLKTTVPAYNQLKENLETAKKELEKLQKQLEEKSAEVAELSSKPTLEAAKEDVKEKQNALTRALNALEKTKETNDLEQQRENLDMQAQQEDIQKLKDKVEQIKNSSDVKEIKAEKAGIVTSIDCKEGDSVTTDAPLAKIQVEDSGYIVKITVTKAQAKLIGKGNEATIENIWDDDTTAEVKSIKADPENPNQNMIVTFEVKGDVEVGQTLSLAVGEKSNRYDAVVPNNAIREDSKGKFVLIITVKGTPLGNRYKVKRADVEVLASDDTSSGVSGGVCEGDNVATNSSKPLEEGMQVRLVE